MEISSHMDPLAHPAQAAFRLSVDAFFMSPFRTASAAGNQEQALSSCREDTDSGRFACLDSSARFFRSEISARFLAHHTSGGRRIAARRTAFGKSSARTGASPKEQTSPRLNCRRPVLDKCLE